MAGRFHRPYRSPLLEVGVAARINDSQNARRRGGKQRRAGTIVPQPRYHDRAALLMEFGCAARDVYKVASRLCPPPRLRAFWETFMRAATPPSRRGLSPGW